MLLNLVYAWCCLALCVVIHATGLTVLLQRLRKHVRHRKPHLWQAAWILSRVAGWTILLHVVQIAAWASVYAIAGALANFTSAFYFSAVTYTTTGYGDLVLPEEWRVVGGIEALTGILMCGLSTGMFFAVFSEIFGLHRKERRVVDP